MNIFIRRVTLTEWMISLFSSIWCSQHSSRMTNYETRLSLSLFCNSKANSDVEGNDRYSNIDDDCAIACEEWIFVIISNHWSWCFCCCLCVMLIDIHFFDMGIERDRVVVGFDFSRKPDLIIFKIFIAEISIMWNSAEIARVLEHKAFRWSGGRMNSDIFAHVEVSEQSACLVEDFTRPIIKTVNQISLFFPDTIRINWTWENEGFTGL